MFVKKVEKCNKIKGKSYLPIEVIHSNCDKLIRPSLDEGCVFIQIYDESLSLIEVLK